MRIYIDSSAFVKCYGKLAFEKGTDQIERIVNEARAGKHLLFSSYWLMPEVLASIDSWQRKGYITIADKKIINSQLLKDVREWLERGLLVFLSLTPQTYMESDFLYLVSEEHLTPGDALHIYTANLLGPDILVTADSSQLRVAKTLGINIFDPEKEAWQ